MRISARRTVLAVVSAVAATLLVSGGAAASLGAPASTGSPAGTAAPGGTGAPADYVFVHDTSMAMEGGTYYLFVSFDTCCAGISSTYRIMAGRSASVTGPYVDPACTSMMNSGGMEVQGSDEGMIGPGSSSIFTEGSRSYLVYHYYDAFDSGDPWVQVRPLIWAPGGWPVTGPPLTPVPGSPVPLR